MAQLPAGALQPAYIGPEGVPGSGPRRAVTSDAGPALSQRDTNRAFGGVLAHEVAPSALALGGSLLVPEAAPLGWLLRMGAAGLGGGIGEAGAQAVMGEPTDLPAIANRAARETAVQGSGEAASGLLRVVGGNLVGEATKPGMRIRKKTPNIDEIVMRERIPVGSPGTTTGQAEIARRAAEVQADLQQSLLRAGPRGRVAGTPRVPAVPQAPGTPSIAPAMPAAATAAPDATYLADVFRREANAVQAIQSAAKAHGMAPDDLTALIMNPNPRALDIGTAQSRYGLAPGTINDLRQFAPTLTEANASRAAQAAGSPQGATAFLPGPTPGAPGSPAIPSTPARPLRRGVVHSTDEVLSAVDAEIATLRKSAHPDDAAEADLLQGRRDAFAARNPNGLSPAKLDRAVRASQKRARATYQRDVNGQPVTVQTTADEQMFHRLVARQGRQELRAKVPGVAEAKDRAKDLVALGDVYRQAESRQLPPLADLGNLTRILSTAAQRTLLRPDVASRTGFLATDPRVLRAARAAPLSVETLLEIFNAPAKADATNRGGNR